ncbi:HAD family hydrolase, partial [Enterococcus faecium]|nr:HAD family hydrolase [Enterococcus faecium]
MRSSKYTEHYTDTFITFKEIINGYTGMATVFLTNFIRCRTSFRMLFRLSLT